METEFRMTVNGTERRVTCECHRAAGPLGIPLSQIAWRTWSGVSCCGACPVSVNS
jgi:hypothetical protein